MRLIGQKKLKIFSFPPLRSWAKFFVLVPSAIDISQTSVTVTTTSITIDSVESSNSGVFSSFGFKKLGDISQTASPLPTSLSSLAAGTCYKLTIVLFCDTLEGAAAEQVICTQHEASVDSETTTSVSVVWPMAAATLTANSITVSSYASSLDGGADIDRTANANAAFTLDGFTVPGKVHTLATKICLSNGQSAITSATINFCVKPDQATITHADTVSTTSSVQFANLAVASGEKTGLVLTLNGCGLSSAATETITTDTTTFNSLVAGCKYSISIVSFCHPDGSTDANVADERLFGTALTFDQCTGG